jgi:hypothetical protein
MTPFPALPPARLIPRSGTRVVVGQSAYDSTSTFFEGQHDNKESYMKPIDLPTTIAGIDTDQLLKSSRASRAGARLIQAATLLRASSTIIALVVVCLLTALSALAQQPTGGSILANEASRPVSLVKRGIDVFSWLMIIAGIGGIGRAIYIGMRGAQGWGTAGGWGAAGLGFGYLVSWINSEVNGNQVALPEP